MDKDIASPVVNCLVLNIISLLFSSELGDLGQEAARAVPKIERGKKDGGRPHPFHLHALKGMDLFHAKMKENRLPETEGE